MSTLTIIHFSDLHFGRIQDHVLSELEAYLKSHEQEINLVILTGDLTQRAKKAQFIAAKNFLIKIPIPVFIVPGNHDVPLYNLFLRFLSPYSKFKKYMGSMISNFYEDKDLIVFGLWTVNPFKVAAGKIRESDILLAIEKFKATEKGKIKIIACHHPIATHEDPKIKKLFEKLIAEGPHFLLWGHDHQSSIQYFDEGKKLFPLMLASGTTISSRVREEANSFNVIKITGNDVVIETLVHEDKNGFVSVKEFKAEIKR